MMSQRKPFERNASTFLTANGSSSTCAFEIHFSALLRPLISGVTCLPFVTSITVDLEAPALELETPATARQGILGRLDVNAWRSSSNIEALRNQDATTKSIFFSQFVNFLDLIAYRLQRWLLCESVVLATADIG
jgi:hypothetical protein